MPPNTPQDLDLAHRDTRRTVQLDDYARFLVDSVDEAAARIVELIRNPGLRETLGMKARTTVRERFLLPHMLEDYLDLFGGFETLYRLNDCPSPGR